MIVVLFEMRPMEDIEGSIALCELFPEFVGHGDDGQDAADDLRDQLEALTWH